MQPLLLRCLIVSAIVCPTYEMEAGNPASHPLFEADAVHEIFLTFHQVEWWDSLVHNLEDFDEPRYLAAEFDWSTVHFDSIGVRFKGQSSYHSYPTEKKPFKIDFNRFVDSQDLYGLDKLNLSNGFKDPSFVREICCYELCAAAGLPTQRTNYAALYINDVYWGLYTLVEQYDQEFIESRFGASEGGNLWKGDNHGTLEYLGPDQEAYYGDYELKTNEEENDWSALIELADVLNNTSPLVLPDTIGKLVDLSTAMALLAVDNLTVNLDSYAGRCCNYYVYHRDLDGRFVFSNWDLNEAWGCFNFGMPVYLLEHLDPFWTVPSPDEQRPLGEKLWQIDAFRELYLGHMRSLMAGAAYPDTLLARMEDLRDLIRPYVYADTKKMYSNGDFEAAMTVDIGGGPDGVCPGLEPFIRERDAWLRTEIGTWNPIDGVVMNELMADNETTTADENGEYEDWIEITNIGSQAVLLAGITLTDDLGRPDAFTFPDLAIEPQEHIIVWADGQTEQGTLHADFTVSLSGETIFLLDGGVVLDETTFGPLGTDISWGRWPDGVGEWKVLSEATPEAENQDAYVPEEIDLFLNELLAVNNSVNCDEAGEYEDWVEIYNPGPDGVLMGGLFLTDDMSNTMKWAFPETILEARAFMVIWCDDDEGDGPFHANFRLDGDGEQIGLFGRLTAGNQEIDSHSFGSQNPDISEGRRQDGSEVWVFFSTPTPESSNNDGVEADTPLVSVFSLEDPYPNPFTESTAFRFSVSAESWVMLEIYDLCGQRVAAIPASPYGQGEHTIVWDGTTVNGERAVAGSYVARLVAEDCTAKKIIIMLR